MRLLSAPACVALVALAPLPGFADVELEAAVRADATWTDNVFGVNEDTPTDSDFSVRLTPDASLVEDSGDLRWNLRYRPAYEYYLDESSLRGFDHDVGAELTWQLTDQTSLQASEFYQRYHSFARFNEVSLIVGEPVSLVTRRERLQSSQTTLALTHNWSQRSESSISAAYGYWRPSDRTSEELALDLSFDGNLDAAQDHSEFYSFGILHSYLLGPRTRVGAQLFARHHVFTDDLDDSDRSFDDDLDSEQETDYYGLQLTWNHVVDRTLRVSLSGGPAWVRPGTQEYGSDLIPRVPMVNLSGQTQFEPLPIAPTEPLFFMRAADCTRRSSKPVLDVEAAGANCSALGFPALVQVAPGLSLYSIAAALEPVAFDATVRPDDQVTFFAEASLDKEWGATVTTEIAYERRDEQSNGIGTSSISDTVTAFATWKVTPKLTLDLRGLWEQTEQSGDTVIVGLLLRDRNFVSIPGLGTIRAAEAVGIETFTTDNKFETTTLQVYGGAAYRLSERLTLHSRFLWTQQDLKVPSRSAQTSSAASLEDFESTSEIFSVWLGVEYRFDPIHF